MTSSNKNITFSKAGATLTCLVCGDTDTYQIGQLDRDKWARGVRGKYRCKTCRAIPPYVPMFPPSIGSEPKEDIDKLMDMI